MSAEANKDFKSTLKGIWKDPVWSKVISVAILAGLASIWATVKGKWPAIGAGLWSLLTSAWVWLGSASEVWNWLLLVLVAISLVVAYVVIRLYIESRTESIAPLTFRDYRKDHFEGLDWYWSYNAVDAIILLHPCCPQCQLQLEGKYQYSGHGGLRITYTCESCNAVRAKFEEHEDSVKDRIQRFIQQKLRTGSWKQIVEQQRGINK